MRRLMPLTALSLLLLTGCVVPSPQPSESPTPSGFTQGETTTPPAPSPSSVPPPTATEATTGRGGYSGPVRVPVHQPRFLAGGSAVEPCRSLGSNELHPYGFLRSHLSRAAAVSTYGA